MDIPLLETPQSVSVITRDQIELNWQTIEQAVRYTSGIVGGVYGDDGRSDWLFLRGFAPTTYLDGLQLPAGSFASSRMDLRRSNPSRSSRVRRPASTAPPRPAGS